MEHSIGQFAWAQRTESLLLGELHPLLEQLGSADGLANLHATSDFLLCPKLENAETLGVFLQAYQDQMLYAFELPAIYRAYHFASRNQCRELVALDREVSRHPVRAEFAAASRRVGRCQLQKLRPLRDQRIVQRYLQAVETKQADGWHTLVFGLTLAVYSLPVRQGLMSYARQTLEGFIQSASRPLHLTAEECRDLVQAQCTDLPRQLERVVTSISLPS